MLHCKPSFLTFRLSRNQGIIKWKQSDAFFKCKAILATDPRLVLYAQAYTITTKEIVAAACNIIK